MATWSAASRLNPTMYHYHLNLIGLKILLQSHLELASTERAHAFLSAAPDFQPDHIWTLEPTSVLVPAAEPAQWSGLRRYSHHHDHVIEHYLEDYQTMFCMTVLKKNGDVMMQYGQEFTDFFPTIDSIFHYMGLESFLLQHGGLLLHSSLIRAGDCAIVFTAPSGTGKSTQAELWKHFRGAEILNGDRAALVRSNDIWTAYGSPYAGTSGIYRNDSAPLTAIVVLKQAPENRITRLQGHQILKHLYPELSLHRWDPHFIQASADLITDLISDVPVFLLECVPEESAVQLLYCTLSKGNLLT